MSIYANNALHYLGSRKEYAALIKKQGASNIWFEILKDGDAFDRFVNKYSNCKDLYSRFLDLEKSINLFAEKGGI